MQTWVEIDKTALLGNVEALRNASGRTPFMAVVKSNAYGHHLETTAGILSGHVDWFGVNSIEEAHRVRSVDTTTPVLVMGAPDPSLAKDAAALGGVRLVVSSVEEFRSVSEEAPGASFVLKTDTGMSRLGTRGEKFEALLDAVRLSSCNVEGVMTHFANVEDVTDQSYAELQLARFQEVRRLATETFPGKRLLFHAAASAAALILPASRLDLVRFGISLYGFWPSRETRISALSLFGVLPDLKPVLSWKSRIVHVNDVEAGAYIGYGCTHRVSRDTRVGIIPVGYFEGYERGLSNRSYVLVRGRRARLLGRVCMNMIMVDLTDIPGATAGDIGVLIGSDNGDQITAEELADLTSTIHYEVVTRIQPDLPRIVVDKTQGEAAAAGDSIAAR